MVEQELLGYPRFQFVQPGDGGATVSIVHADFSSAPGGHDVIQGLLPDLLREAGLEQGDPASADWTIRFDPSARDDLRPGARAAWESAGALGERYVIQNTSDVGGAFTRLWAENARGALYAIRSALQLVGSGGRTKRVPAGTIVDFPMQAERGVIEGFYGRPYSSEDRCTLLRLMARVRENIYVYGPKADAYTRKHWRDSYRDGAEAPIATAAELARSLGLRFVWAISPGGSFDFGAPDADFARLMERVAEMQTLGIDEFALFLDDVPLDFGQHATAHAALANRLQAQLSTPLHFVGTTYHGAPILGGPNPYTDVLGQSLAPEVQVFWTGKDVYSPPMSESDMGRINESLRRRVTIWDNWPDTKLSLLWKPGPVERGTDFLHRATAGFLSNPTMNELGVHPARAFWKVLGPLADYTWNPVSYAPEQSYAMWQQHIG